MNHFPLHFLNLIVASHGLFFFINFGHFFINLKLMSTFEYKLQVLSLERNVHAHSSLDEITCSKMPFLYAINLLIYSRMFFLIISNIHMCFDYRRMAYIYILSIMICIVMICKNLAIVRKMNQCTFDLILDNVKNLWIRLICFREDIKKFTSCLSIQVVNKRSNLK